MHVCSQQEGNIGPETVWVPLFAELYKRSTHAHFQQEEWNSSTSTICAREAYRVATDNIWHRFLQLVLVADTALVVNIVLYGEETEREREREREGGRKRRLVSTIAQVQSFSLRAQLCDTFYELQTRRLDFQPQSCLHRYTHTHTRTHTHTHTPHSSHDKSAYETFPRCGGRRKLGAEAMLEVGTHGLPELPLLGRPRVEGLAYSTIVRRHCAHRRPQERDDGNHRASHPHRDSTSRTLRKERGPPA